MITEFPRGAAKPLNPRHGHCCSSPSHLSLARVEAICYPFMRDEEKGVTHLSPYPAAPHLPPLRSLSPSDAPHVLRFLRLHSALDVPHWRDCTAGRRVMSLSDYLQAEQASTVDAKVWWWYPELFLLNVCKQLAQSTATPIRLLPHQELSEQEVSANSAGWWGRITAYEKQRVGSEPLLRYCRAAPIPPYEVTLSQFLSFFGTRSEPVISLGDVWMVTAPPGDPLPVHFSGGPHGPIPPPSPHCGVVMSPPPAILHLVEEFIASQLSGSYAAVHLRRGDFVAHCRKRKCGHSIRQLSGCLSRRLNRLSGEMGLTRRRVAPVLDGSMGGVWRDVVVEGVVEDEISRGGFTLFLATDAKPSVSDGVDLAYPISCEA